MSEQYSFEFALGKLKENYKMTRVGWNGEGMYIAIQLPDEHSKMTSPYIYMKTAEGKLVPWIASQTDLLAEDWEIVHEAESNEPAQTN